MPNGNKTGELVRRLQNGDDSVFTELCELYEGLVTKSASSFCKSASAIEGKSDDGQLFEELRQEAHLALYRASKSYDLSRVKVTFGLYAKKCITNALISYLRKLKSTTRVVAIDGDEAGGVDTAERIIDSEQMKAISEMLSEVLTVYENKVFTRFICGQKPREIAVELKTSAKSVSNAIFRARVKLKKLPDEDLKKLYHR